jgi:hypothetical protein
MKPLATYKLTAIATALSLLSVSSVTLAEDVLIDALTSGKVSFSARARYESVEQDNALKDADAYTVRTTLGYKTGAFHGFSGFFEAENVAELGDGHFNDKVNGDATYSVVADPTGTEMNQTYLQYNGFDTEFKLGRQELTYRGAPFHRFIGNVLWRQNHQSFDAFSFTNTALTDTKLSYAFVNKVQTILGGVDHMDSHLFNAQYSGLPIGTLEAYGYLLDYNDVAKRASSSETFGIRLSGGQAVNEDWKVIYTAEYANQSDYKDGKMDYQNYYLAELGGKYNGWLAKFSYEMQEGDGDYSFKTPLGTNHAFQGWADMFLATPKEGLEDMYFTIVANVLGAKVVAVYHDFETDQGGLDAGDELDLLVEKTFKKHYTLGVKYSDYNGGNQYNNAHPTAKIVDTEKFWVYGQVKF